MNQDMLAAWDHGEYRMNLRSFRLALIALAPIAAIALGSAALGQAPAPAASPTPTPADPPPQHTPGAAARGNQIPGRHPLRGPDPHAATARAGSDRRPLWRAVHAGGKKGGGHARHRQLG